MSHPTPPPTTAMGAVVSRLPARRLSAGLLVLSTSLGDAHASIYLGNPKLHVSPAPVTGLTFTSVSTDDPTLHLPDCGPTTVGTGSTELLGTPVVIDPAFCSVSLGTDGVLLIEGDGANGSTFELRLDLDEVLVALSAGEPMGPNDDGGAYVLELGAPGWTSAQALGLQANTHTVIDGTDPVHDDLVDAILGDSAVFADPNGDGVLSGTERSAGAL